MKQSQKNYKRIVIKVGSSLFYTNKKLDKPRFFQDIANLNVLKEIEHKQIVIVSSGAIALGMESIKLSSRPRELPLLQAVAAIGQNILINDYSKYFKKYNITCAQILLTWDDFDNRQRYLNAGNTLEGLLRLGCVPIVNENDTISTDEIRFGDNDRLSALVAKLISADLLVILSDVDGLLDRNKKLIRLVDEIDAGIKSLACPTRNKTCVGGMVSKIEAAKICVDSGIACVIANGRTNVIVDIARDPLLADGVWTAFLPKKGLTAKKHWMAFGTRVKGRIIVDDGAKQALLNNKSLLSVGVSGVQGNFSAGDIVGVMDNRGSEFARGKAGINSSTLEKVKGSRWEKEVIHRDNIVILD